jgi:hypothetical protein
LLRFDNCPKDVKRRSASLPDPFLPESLALLLQRLVVVVVVVARSD